ncbi:MAG: ABC transporter permease [Candidatus Thorarchaeota archaeon]
MTVSVQEKDEKPRIESIYMADFKPRMMDWSAARIFAMKNLRIAMRYPSNWVIWAFMPILWFAPFILMVNAIAGPENVYFTELSGFSDYIQFSVIGWFVYMFLDNSIWAIGNNFRWEQFSGTLEPLFSTPVPRISILLGAAFSDTALCIIQSLVLLAISMVMFGVSYSLIAILPTIIIMIVMVIALYGFSFMVAGLILVFKDPSVLTELVSNATYVVSPVQYPIQTLPSSIRFFAYLIPTTIGIITVRELAITGVFDLLSFAQVLFGLSVLGVFFWTLGLGSFKYAEKWTKSRGHMGDF